MTRLTAYCLLLVCIGAVEGLIKEKYPNPLLSPSLCWRHENELPNENLFVCDPDSLMTSREATQINNLVNKIRKETNCPCNGDVCFRQRLYGGATRRGFTISVALVKKMDYNPAGVSIIQRARIYANHLRTRRNYFDYDFSMCEEDIIVFFAYDEKVVYVLTGSKAGERIDDKSLKDLIDDSIGDFKSGVFYGIKAIVEKLRLLIHL